MVHLKTTGELQQIMDYIIQNLPRKCKRCGSEARLVSLRSDALRCTWAPCGLRQSVLANTIFEWCKIDKLLLISVLDCWMAKCSLRHISLFTRCPLSTVQRILANVEGILVPKYYGCFVSVGGENTIVEIDESKFGKRKYNRGHAVEGVWVLGMTERTPKRKIILVVVPCRTKEQLSAFIRRYVHPGSTVYTDCWKGYTGIEAVVDAHCTVNHTRWFKDPETGVHTNTIEGNWAAVKNQIPVRNRTTEGISLYLVRFMILRDEEGDSLLNLLKYLI
jgi:transposase-like protein